MLTPFAHIMQSLTPSNIPAQIANVHTVFNVVTTILLLPFGKKLVQLAYIILPEKEGLEDKMTLKYLDFGIFENDYHNGTSAIANTQLFNETQNMLNVAIDNVRKSFELMIDFKEEKFEKLQKNEDYINYLNKNIVDFTTNALSIEFPIEGSQTIGLFLKVSADLERVGDHAVNIALRAKNLYEENRHFSHEAMDEIGIMSSLCTNILDELRILNYDEFKGIVDKVDVIEDNIDKTPVSYTHLDVYKRQAIRSAQIVMLPGGFSAGDEPEGSGKFIATVLRNPKLKDAISDLLDNREGLMIGICNGFQALVKLGLLPYGHIKTMDKDDPTLTFNTIGRHLSQMVDTRIASVKSVSYTHLDVYKRQGIFRYIL